MILRPSRWLICGACCLALQPPMVRAQSTTTVMGRTYYEATGRLKSETVDGVTKLYTYTPSGDLETITDPNGYVVRYADHKRGIAQTEIHAEGRAEQVITYRAVDARGCVTAEVDGERNTIGYIRDDLCRVVVATPAKIGSANAVITYSPYTASAPETHTFTRGNLVRIDTFDGFGRLSERTEGGIHQTWGYDGLDRKIFESYPAEVGASTTTGVTLEYDALNRLIKKTEADGNFSKFVFGVSSTGAPQTTITDERGKVFIHTFRKFASDDSQELMSIKTQVPSADVTLTRNVRGQITSVSQAGYLRQYGYDSRFYLTSVSNPETGVTLYGRDNNGNMTSVQVADSSVTYFDIDGLSQVYGIRYADSSKNVSQLWYKNGLKKSATTSTSSRTWSYDSNANLTQDSLNVGGQQFDTAYEYDSNDRLARINYPKKGSSVDLVPDALGRPTKLGNYVSSVQYHPNGSIKSMVYANGVVTNMVPDVRLRPRFINVGKGGGSGYVGQTLGYDGASNLISVADSAYSGNNRVYEYDDIERIAKVRIGPSSYPIVYDGAGNIKSQSYGGLINYNYDAVRNRLSSTTGAKPGTYTYDVRGNIASNGFMSFVYDDNSRLRCAKCGTADQVAYDYDALGMRVSRTKGGQASYQVYSRGGDLLMDFSPSTNKRQEHIYLQGQKVATFTDNAFFATSVGLALSSPSVKPGQSLVLTATVTGGKSPGGVVNFYDNGVWIGSASVINGRAIFNTPPLNFGYHRFSSSYAGDGANAVSNSGAGTLVESGAVTATIMSIVSTILLND